MLPEHMHAQRKQQERENNRNDRNQRISYKRPHGRLRFWGNQIVPNILNRLRNRIEELYFRNNQAPLPKESLSITMESG